MEGTDRVTEINPRFYKNSPLIFLTLIMLLPIALGRILEMFFEKSSSVIVTFKLVFSVLVY